MKVKLSKPFHSILFIYVFITPNTIYNIIDIEYSTIFFTTLVAALFMVISMTAKQSTNRVMLMYMLSMVCLGLLVWAFKGGVSQHAVLFVPIFSYFGYKFVGRFTIDLRWLNIVFVVLYVYYYVIYFSKLPDLFYRPGFDEDAIVFERASSNGIAVALNITLYAYIVLEYYYKQHRYRDILILSLCNTMLIIIQQSRTGIVCAVLLLLIVIVTAYRKWLKKGGLWFSLVSILFIAILLKDNLSNLFSQFDIGVSAYSDDVRGQATSDFFKLIWEYGFFWGTPIGTQFGILSYTYNVFLDFWNSYSFLGLTILMSIIIMRIVNRKHYYFPTYYLLPFFLYAMVESFFFPGYWDVIIYLLLLLKTPRKTQPEDIKLVPYG